MRPRLDPDGPEMLDVDQAAALLGVSRRQVERLIHTVSLPGSVRIKGARRIHGPTLRRWIADRRPFVTTWELVEAGPRPSPPDSRPSGRRKRTARR